MPPTLDGKPIYLLTYLALLSRYLLTTFFTFIPIKIAANETILKYRIHQGNERTRTPPPQHGLIVQGAERGTVPFHRGRPST